VSSPAGYGGSSRVDLKSEVVSCAALDAPAMCSTTTRAGRRSGGTPQIKTEVEGRSRACHGDLLSRETTKSLRGILAFDDAAQVALEITAAGAGSHRQPHEALNAANEQIRRIGKHCSGRVDLSQAVHIPRTALPFWRPDRALREVHPPIAGRGISKEEFVYSFRYKAPLPSDAAANMTEGVMTSNCVATCRKPSPLEHRTGGAP